MFQPNPFTRLELQRQWEQQVDRPLYRKVTPPGETRIGVQGRDSEKVADTGGMIQEVLHRDTAPRGGAISAV